MSRCCVSSCTSDSRKACGVSFHRIPRDPAMRERWLLALQGHSSKASVSSSSAFIYVCSLHFSEDCFVKMVSIILYIVCSLECSVSEQVIVFNPSMGPHSWAQCKLGHIVVLFTIMPCLLKQIGIVLKLSAVFVITVHEPKKLRLNCNNQHYPYIHSFPTRYSMTILTK